MASPKTGILALLASPKGKSGPAKPGSPPPMGDEGTSEGPAALREVFDLLKAGEDDAAWTAFKRAKAACDDDYESDDDEGPPSGSGDDDDLEM